MTLKEFYGCTFIAFGLPLWLFVHTIAIDSLRIIVVITSGFFWLLSIFLSSLLWFAVVPLRDTLAFGLVLSVLFQEAFRLVFFLILKKAEQGLKKVSQQAGTEQSAQLINNRHLMAYVAGLGFGLLSGAFSLVNVLADSTGPGTVGIHGDSAVFFIVSALLTGCYILLHTSWNVLFYDGLYNRSFIKPLAVVLSHMFVSCMTLLNQQGTSDVNAISLAAAFSVLVFVAPWAYKTAGGSVGNFYRFLTCSRPHQS